MGSVVISLDAELAWGFHDLARPSRDRIAGARAGWRRALSLLDRFDVPATWAVVGHLYLDTCDGVHADHPASPGWFDRDPGTDRHRDPDWYARDLVEAIFDAGADHELACHSFSHVPFGDDATTLELARAELSASRSAAETLGIRPDSFVFPRNDVGHRQALVESGFQCYRSRWPRGVDHTPLRGPLKLVETLLGQEVPIVRPRIDDYGLVAIPPSVDLFGFESHVRRLLAPVVEEPILRRVERGIDKVARTDGILHVWFHPSDVASDAAAERLRRVLAAIDDRRDRGDVRVETMGEVARRTLAAPPQLQCA